jgi:hypothetical protein
MDECRARVQTSWKASIGSALTGDQGDLLHLDAKDQAYFSAS